jgi:hypothetical protein
MPCSRTRSIGGRVGFDLAASSLFVWIGAYATGPSPPTAHPPSRPGDGRLQRGKHLQHAAFRSFGRRH